MRRAFVRLGFATSLALVLLPLLALPAAADLTGSCSASINGVDVRGRSSTDTRQAIVVNQDASVPVALQAGSSLNQVRIQLEFGGMRWTVREENTSGTSWQNSVRVKDYASVVGLYKVIGESSGPGGTCSGAALVHVKGADPLTTPLGQAGAAVLGIGALGLAITGIAAAAQGLAGAAGGAASASSIAQSVREDLVQKQVLEPTGMGYRIYPAILGDVQRFVDPMPSEVQASADIDWEAHKKRGGPMPVDQVEVTTPQGEGRRFIDDFVVKPETPVLIHKCGVPLLGRLERFVCFMALPGLLLACGAVPMGAPAGRGGSGMPRVQLQRARWRPRISIFGMLSGFVFSVGGVVMAQQYALAYPTQETLTQWLGSGVLLGIVLPSFFRLFAVWRANATVGQAEREVNQELTRMWAAQMAQAASAARQPQPAPTLPMPRVTSAPAPAQPAAYVPPTPVPPAPPATAAAPSPAPAAGSRFCTECGSPVQAGKRFCTGCGNRLA